MYGPDRNPNNLAPENKTAAKLGDQVEGISGSEKPNVVRVPRVKVVAPPPLTAEPKVPSKFSHPAIRWPLYSLGGYLILRWAWTRWKESQSDGDDKGKKKKGS
ncbi:uncharacterized protein LOC111010218 [Momordica charantia]|uniref:Uncharacterized protein LOC111010218 n=1 Tax=Momordica charantia TaxID=3673 RepID=A0A6J1CDG9_MOMCH|nr:uncharacterized protein LOC111010218 [Momordica charantia]